MTSLLIKNGTIVTVDAANSIVHGDLLIADGRIIKTGTNLPPADQTIDASGCAVIPGFVQTHIHLCQTIFRGMADDLSLIDWLKKRVWPMEAAHTAESIRASAQLGIAELIKGGTTCALTMETVQHTEEVFKVVEQTGFRATVGKCMMDKGDEVPAGLQEQTDESVQQSLELLEKWHGRADGRIRYCFAPRFAISCTEKLLKEVARLAREHKVMVHTHASENRTECELVEKETGLRNVQYLNSVGLTGANVALAHCVHLNDEEIATLAGTGTNVAHCPSSNLKLGSGFAPIVELLRQGISVSLGADGAACNNRLDMFTEMRTAALLQKAIHGPEVMTATETLRMATIQGAKALGLGNEIGSLEEGKRADIAVVRLDGLHTSPETNPISSLVYAAKSSDVQTVLVDGKILLDQGRLLTLDERSVMESVRKESLTLVARSGLR